MSETTSPLTTQPRKQRTPRRWALVLVALLATLSFHWLLFQGREVASGVIVRPLGPCDVEWFQYRAVVLACPHIDLIKIWPLPVEQPWWEDSPYGERVAQR